MKINWTTSCAPQPDFKSSPIPKVVLATGCVGGECVGGAANDLGAAGDARLGRAKQQGQPTPAISVRTTSARPHSAAGPLHTSNKINKSIFCKTRQSSP